MGAQVPIATVVPFDWRKALWKGVRVGAGFLASAAYTGMLLSLSNEATVTGLFKNHPELLFLSGAVVGGAKYLLNKNKVEKAAGQ